MKAFELSSEYLNRIVETALAEDAGRGDVTSEALVPSDLEGRAYMLIKEDGVLAGAVVVQKVFQMVDPQLQVNIQIADGTPVKSGDIPMLIIGNVRSILKAERVSLNFYQRLSGIATTTAQYVARVKDLKVDIADTRKTTPCLRLLEKYAVRMAARYVRR